MIRNVLTDVWAKLGIIAMTSIYYVLFNAWIMLQLTVLQTVGNGVFKMCYVSFGTMMSLH